MSVVQATVHRTFPKSVQPGIPRLAAPKLGWSEYKFGDLFDVVQRPIKMDDNKEYDLVTVQRSRGGIRKRSRLVGSKISVKNQFVLQENDFLISKRQIVHGACAIVPSEFSGSIVSNEYSVLRCKPEFDLNFIGYLSHTIYFQQTCFHSSIGVHVEKMIFKLNDWFMWPINLPPLLEQKKIASFLRVMDDKLSALKSKRDLLGEYKRGLMQKLFSQELRFTKPNGHPFPDWEEKLLGDVFEFSKGAGLPKSELCPNGQFKCIHYGELFTKYNEVISATSSRTDAQDIPLGQEGDILTPASDVTPDGLARASTLRVSDVRLGGDIIIWRPKSECHSEFISYLVSSNKKMMMRLVTGTTVKHIYGKDLKKILVALPDPDEQQKIADTLSALDAKICAVSDQITALQDFKKGLLQQMFV